MPSELDRRLAAIVAKVTVPGSLFETTVIERGGVSLTVFAHAPETLPALFDRFCAQHSDAEFLVDGDVRLSFAQVHALARRFATGLVMRHHVRLGDRIGIAARNSANWIIAYMGVLMAGGCATLLNGWSTGDELAASIVLTNCTLVLADRERALRIARYPTMTNVVLFDHGHPEHGLVGVLGNADDAWRLPEIKNDDLATIKFTSGSTGTAKGAVSDHRAMTQATINFALQSLIAFKGSVPEGTVPPPQATLLSIPLFHVTGEIALLLQSFVTGRRVIVMPRWDAEAAMQLIERERITFFGGVPLMSMEIASHPARSRYDLSSCVGFLSGGSPRPTDHVGLLHESLPHAAQYFGYGLTETNATGCCNIDNCFAKPASAGPAMAPLIEVAVLGPNGACLPAGLRGEIAVRSICNILGYWDNPAETEAALRDDGFFLSGDIGYLDEAGYLFVVDRKKDIIVRGGENIASAEVERAIYAHPGVAEVSVFGLPDARYGEVPVAVFAAKQGHPIEEAELIRYLADRIAAFKVPVRFWREENALPRLGSEKIDKRSLKARYSQAWEAARTAQ